MSVAATAARLPARHGFFGRRGGISTGVYATLNAGPGSSDDAQAVAENRARIAAQLGVGPERLLSLHQVHSARAVRVDGPWEGERPQADAMVTTTRGLALGILTADCAPVLFADAEAGVIGAAHAGWKGALGGVIEACVAEMVEAGARRGAIAAAIGPTIAQASYEVGPEFEARFLDHDPNNEWFFTPSEGDRARFDLPRYVAHRLEQAGIVTVEDLALDTYADEARWFSHRRTVHRSESDYGRNCAAIVL